MKFNLFIVSVCMCALVCNDASAKYKMGNGNSCIGYAADQDWGVVDYSGGSYRHYFCGYRMGNVKNSKGKITSYAQHCKGSYGVTGSKYDYDSNDVVYVMNTNDTYMCCGGNRETTGAMKKCKSAETADKRTISDCYNEIQTYTHYDDICAIRSDYGNSGGKNIKCSEEQAAGRKVPGVCGTQTNICGTSVGTVCKADADNCKGEGMFVRNKACITKCPAGQVFESKISNTCIPDCPVTKTSGPISDHEVDSKGHNVYFWTCTRCVEGVQLYNPQKHECINKDDLKPVNRGGMLNCWKCSQEDMKDCLKGEKTCELKKSSNDN